MTAERAGDRPQDVGRSHKRRGAPAVDTELLLERYRAAMRAELEDLLVEIRPESGQLGAFDGAVERPTLNRRAELWNLAVKLARELAGAPEPIGGAPGSSEPATVPGPRRARPAPRLTVAQRRALGAPE